MTACTIRLVAGATPARRLRIAFMTTDTRQRRVSAGNTEAEVSISCWYPARWSMTGIALPGCHKMIRAFAGCIRIIVATATNTIAGRVIEIGRQPGDGTVASITLGRCHRMTRRFRRRRRGVTTTAHTDRRAVIKAGGQPGITCMTSATVDTRLKMSA